MKNIIFIAPPSAGKGTISDYLAKNYQYKHLSTGDMLRSEVASGSDLGKEIDALISKGKLVGDDLIIRLVVEELNKLKDQAFILDGFPRNIIQAEKLDDILAELDITNNVVIYLDVDLDTALKRALGRVVCPKCKKSYNLNNPELKPIVDNMCDDCKIELEKRSDDTAEIFKERYQTYLVSTSPIITYYHNKGMLVNVNATDSLEEIYQNVLMIVRVDELEKRGSND